jgi:hypothetical protein
MICVIITLCDLGIFHRVRCRPGDIALLVERTHSGDCLVLVHGDLIVTGLFTASSYVDSHRIIGHLVPNSDRPIMI